MLAFHNDYHAGAHPAVLDALIRTNGVPKNGYGDDEYTQSARTKIRTAIEKPNADIYFLVGGTQTNQVVIDTLLNAWEGVISAETGHISVHEAGAIEYSGHKVLTLPSHQGLIHSDELHAFVHDFFADPNHEHMVFLGMVTSAIHQNMEHCIHVKNYMLSVTCAMSMACDSSLMELD